MVLRARLREVRRNRSILLLSSPANCKCPGLGCFSVAGQEREKFALRETFGSL